MDETRTQAVREAMVVRNAVREQLDEVVGLQDAVRADEPDAVHATRVALRTMRGLLTIFAPLLERRELGQLRRELRWGGRQLTAARDLEVLRELFSEDLPPGEAARPVLDDLDRRRALAHAHSVAGVNSSRWAAMISLAAAVSSEPTSAEPVREPRLQALRDLIDVHVECRVRPRLAVAESDPADLHRWHEVRKAVKSARYAWETIAELPTADGSDQEAAAAWKAAASGFGELQDSAVLLEAVSTYLMSLPANSPATSALLDLQRRLPVRIGTQMTSARELLAEALAQGAST